MKLIDLLVRDFPGRGGWPAGALSIIQGYRRDVHACKFIGDSWMNKIKISNLVSSIFTSEFLADDWNTAVITREQYEAALAAASKTVWDGGGLPPVGSEVKIWNDEASTYQKGLVVYSSHKGATVDVGYLFSSGEQGDFSLLTSEDRAEELAINAILYQTEIPTKSAGELYYLIKHGKIPGVRLDDEAGR